MFPLQLGGVVCSLVVLNEVKDALLGSALELGNLSAVLVDLESGHALNAGLLGDFGSSVNINLAEGHHVALLVSDVLEDGSDALARRAPRGREVNDQGLARGVSNQSVEVLDAFDVSNFSHSDFLFCFKIDYS